MTWIPGILATGGILACLTLWPIYTLAGVITVALLMGGGYLGSQRIKNGNWR